MLVSPSEPPLLRTLGTVSLTPEKYGADFLIFSPIGLVGIQRKEIGDLVNSVQDGRLQEQLAKMKQLSLGVVLLEGTTQWTSEGILISSGPTSWTLANHLGVLWGIQAMGYWYGQTSNSTHTSKWLTLFEKWLSKDRHNGLAIRPKVRPAWGTRDNKDWAVGVLSQIDGVSIVRAERIYDKFGMPLKWTVTKEDLMTVDGIGEKTAEKIMNCLSAGVGKSTSSLGH